MLNVPTRLLEAWNRFWFAQISPYPLALFRIVFGCYFLVFFLASAWNVPLFYSNQGVYTTFLMPDIAPSPFMAVVLYEITVLLMVALIVGYRVRVTAPLLLLFYGYHFCLNIWVRACSFDRAMLIALLFLCFTPSDLVLSINSRKRPPDVKPTVSAWTTRLLAIHMCLFYLSTGIYKALDPDWQNGQLLKAVMSNLYSSNLSFAFVAKMWPPVVYDLMSRAVIIFELICPIGFLISNLKFETIFSDKPVEIRGVQYYFFALGLVFHTGIAVFMQIPQFFISPVYYVLMVPGKDIERCLNHLQAALARLTKSKSATSRRFGFPSA